MAVANTRRGRVGRRVRTRMQASLMVGLLLGAGAQASQNDRDAEPAPEDAAPAEERVVMSAAALKEDPTVEGISLDELGPEQVDPPVAPRLEPDPRGCQLPALTLEALEPASQRAILRVFGQPPRLVKPGSTIRADAEAERAKADEAVRVRLVREDLLVADGPAGADGKRPVLWIHPPEAPGATSRVQCFLPGIVSP